MKKGRRFLVLLLLLCMTVAFSVSGCGNKGDGDAKSAVAADKLNFVELNFYYPCSIQNDDEVVNAEINKILKEKVNCSLTLKPIDWSQWNNKYPILLSSGEKLDLIFTAAWSGYFQEAAKNSFLQLDDLLKNYGKDIIANMQDGYLDAPKVKGKLFAIPVNKDMGQGWGVVADKKMAEQIGADFSKVKYLEDLEPILAAAKEKLNGVIPYFVNNEQGMNDLIGTTKLCESIGLKNHEKILLLDDYIMYNVDTGKAIPIYEIPEYVEQCRMVNKWYNLGYINNDATTTQMTAPEAARNNKAFMNSADQSPVTLSSYENEYGKKLCTAELATGIKTTKTLTTSTAIAAHCTNPERAMMVLNLFYCDRKLMNLYAFGVENRQYILKKENVMSLPEGVKSIEETGYNTGNYWELGNNFLLYTWDNEDPDKWNNLKEYNATLYKSPLLGFAFDNSTVLAEVAAHKNVNLEYLQLLLNGVLPPDEIVPKFRQKDKAAGIDRICTEIEKQIKVWQASK